MLDRTHNQLLYRKIQEMRPKRNRMMQKIKCKWGKRIVKKEEVFERLAEYMEELYSDENRGEADNG